METEIQVPVESKEEQDIQGFLHVDKEQKLLPGVCMKNQILHTSFPSISIVSIWSN